MTDRRAIAADDAQVATAERFTAAAERAVAIARIAVVGLFALSEVLEHPPHDETAMLAVVGAYGLFAVVVVAWLAGGRVPTAPIRQTLAGVDLLAITVLTALSGGPSSYGRHAYFLLPVLFALRLRPRETGTVTALTVIAYVGQAVIHDDASVDGAPSLIAVHAGYLAVVGGAATALAFLLARRTRDTAQLAAERTALLTDALTAERRERRTIAEALHDEVVQDVLAARHDLESLATTFGDGPPPPELARADAALETALAELRGTLFELHPYVLDEVGLEGALRTVAQRAGARAGFTVDVELEAEVPEGQRPLVYAIGRELVANVAKHARASALVVRLVDDGPELVLRVIDDGVGPPKEPVSRLADGHLGLTTHALRARAAGGSLELLARPTGGTCAELRLPRED